MPVAIAGITVTPDGNVDRRRYCYERRELDRSFLAYAMKLVLHLNPNRSKGEHAKWHLKRF
jgi:hypothetical protein